MSHEFLDDLERDSYYFELPVELPVSPTEARAHLARLIGDDVEQMRGLHQQRVWGSHILRAVLTVAVENDIAKKYDLIPNIADELIAQPQMLGGFGGISMEEAARSKAKMALFDARRLNDTDTPSLDQFLERWR
jgi:hypothetical protein